MPNTLVACCSYCDRPAKTRGLCPRHYYHWRQANPGKIRPMARRGDGTVDSGGYRVVSVGGRRLKEHRLVMERVLGRVLLPGEEVHHKNGDRLDNRPENLELWSTNQPRGQRVEDKVTWAREILSLYGQLYPEAEVDALASALDVCRFVEAETASRIRYLDALRFVNDVAAPGSREHRKLFAMATEGFDDRGVLFAMYDNRPYDELIWKSIKPPHIKPWKENVDA